MKNVVDFPDTTAIDDEAASWLVRLDSDEPLSDEERTRMAEWLHRSPAHRDRLLELATLWEKLNALAELAVPLAPTAARNRPVRRPRLLAGIGAATAAAALFVFLALFQTQPITATNGLYSSAIGEQRTTTLADGSEVILNTNSQIRVDYDEDRRDVRLIQGEALFVVAKDARRRFRVFAGGGRIEAVGTAFSVYLKEDVLDITVTEGEVALSTTAEAGEVESTVGAPALVPVATHTDLGTLRAGQVATLPRSDEASLNTNPVQLPASRSVQEQELRRRMSWTRGTLTFSRDPLERVVDEISRYTTVKIEFSDPALREMEIGGVFPVGETALMFDTLEAYDLEVTYLSANRVRISRR